jgi:hypothetical protein
VHSFGVFDLVLKHYKTPSTSFAKLSRHIMVTSPACGLFVRFSWIELSILRCDAEYREFWRPRKVAAAFVALRRRRQGVRYAEDPPAGHKLSLEIREAAKPLISELYST